MPPALLENSRAIVPSSTALTGVFRGREDVERLVLPPAAGVGEGPHQLVRVDALDRHQQVPALEGLGRRRPDDRLRRRGRPDHVRRARGRDLRASPGRLDHAVPRVVHAVHPAFHRRPGRATRASRSPRGCRSRCRTATRSPRPRRRRPESRIPAPAANVRMVRRAAEPCLGVVTAATPRRRLACPV